MSNTNTVNQEQLSQTSATPIKEAGVQYNTEVLKSFLSWLKDEGILVTTFLRQGISLRNLTFKATDMSGIATINKFGKPKSYGESKFAQDSGDEGDNKMWVPLNKISSISPQTTQENKFVKVPDDLMEKVQSFSQVECLGHLFAQALTSNDRTVQVFLEKGKKKIYEVLAFDSMAMLCRNEMGSHELVFFHALQNISAGESIESFERRIKRNIENLELENKMAHHQF